MTGMWRLEDSLHESDLSLCYTGLRDPAELVRLGNKTLHLPSHLDPCHCHRSFSAPSPLPISLYLFTYIKCVLIKYKFIQYKTMYEGDKI